MLLRADEEDILWSSNTLRCWKFKFFGVVLAQEKIKSKRTNLHEKKTQPRYPVVNYLQITTHTGNTNTPHFTRLAVLLSSPMTCSYSPDDGNSLSLPPINDTAVISQQKG